MESGGRVCCALKGVLEVWYGAMRGYDVLYCVLCVVCVWGGGGGGIYLGGVGRVDLEVAPVAPLEVGQRLHPHACVRGGRGVGSEGG